MRKGREGIKEKSIGILLSVYALLLQKHLGRGRALLLINLCFLLLPYGSLGQKIFANLDRDKILLGEQVTLQLKIEDINPRTSLISQWINLPDTFNHIEVIKKGIIDTVEVGGYSNFIQEVILTSFDSGKWALPDLQVTVQSKESGKRSILKSAALLLEVLPLDVSDLKEYHDIKDIIEVEIENDYTVIALVVLITILSAFILWKLLDDKKKVLPALQKKTPGVSPLEWAMEQIRLLQNENLPAKSQAKQFYIRLDEIYRRYFFEQIKLHSLQLTSDELMIRLKVFLQNEEVRTKFYQLLRLVSAVKFAKYIPGEKLNDEAVEIARQTIFHIDQLSQRMNRQNAY